MKVDKEKKRLEAIKLRLVLFPTKCRCCNEEFVWERMWRVHRYGINKTCVEWNYCQECMHSQEEVLHEIYTDGLLFGIFGVDDVTIAKKDYTRMKRNLENIPRPIFSRKSQ